MNIIFFHHLLKTSLFYRVKHKSFKNVATALPLLDDKVVNSKISKKNSLNT